MNLKLGVTIKGRYQLNEFIKTGGMGEVWKARDLTLDRLCVVKVLRKGLLEGKENGLRFRREIQAAALIDHPGVVAAYDNGTDNGIEFMVMEFVPGMSLADLIRSAGSISVERTLSIISQVASALAAAHERGFIHRDIKPGNILVTPAGEVKITDFGITHHPTQEPLTSTGQLMGTADYLSPEQAAGTSATELSDIYAIGIVGFECLTGTPPFTRETAVTTAVAHIYEAPPPFPETIPKAVQAMILSMIAKDSAERPRSAAALVKMVDQLESGATDDKPGIQEQTTVPLSDLRAGGNNPKVTKLTTKMASPFTPASDSEDAKSQSGPRPSSINWGLGIRWSLVGVGLAAVMSVVVNILNSRG